MLFPIIGAIIGVVAGVFIPYTVSASYSIYVAIAILAAFDSMLGGFVAMMNKNFKLLIFITGFFGNAILSVLIVFLGTKLGLDLYIAVIFIYLIMVAQFQSLLSPFIIMFCIPLAFTGGFIALFITGNELGIISMLGFIMLAGLIVNNGIVLIDYINQARREGMSKHEAIIDAGRTRLRPILMTAMTTILAMFTSAIGIGDGSDMIKPMAIAIIGGLVYGTILTLIVIPCIYDAFNREKSMVEEEL